MPGSTLNRLYYENAYLTTFTARVVAQLTWDNRPAVVLDRTAFYPEGGGQPADRGTLNEVPVLDVQVRPEDEAVIHILARPLAADEVQGVVDWARRYDHMQQHTAQHILSQAFLRVAEAETVGVHLGKAYTTIDLDRAHLSAEDIQRAHDLANRIIEENRAVKARFVGEEELARLALRRPPKGNGPVRVVEVVDFDVIPCGGTHVRHTGEVGLLAITRVEQRGAETRVTFLAGRRARADYARRREIVTRLGDMLTCGDDDLIPRVERLLAENRALASALRKARERLLDVESTELWENAPVVGKVRVIVADLADREGELARKLAGILRGRGEAVILLGWREKERGRVLFAASPGISLHLGQVVRQSLASAGGRGGGRPEWAEGGVSDPARVPQVLEEARRQVVGALAG